MKIKMNKKADKVVSVYWFVILFMVTAAVAYMMVIFYGAPKDVRSIEAGILADKIADCFSEGGYLKQEVLEEDFKENFLENCNLNLNVEDVYDWKEQGQYYLEADFYKFEQNAPDSIGEKIFDISEGNPNLKNIFLLEQATEKKTVIKEREIDTIVIHYTETLSLERTIQILRDDGLTIHYIIDRDGFVASEENEEDILPMGFLKLNRALVKESKKADHAGCYDTRTKETRLSCESEMPESGEVCCVPGFNQRSIGIELVNLGNTCGNEVIKAFCQEQGNGVEIDGVIWEKFPEEQIDALVSLVSDIASRYNIPIDRQHIIGHNEIAPGYKTDPGEAFPWEEFISRLESEKKISSYVGKDFYTIDEQGNQYVIRILSVIGKNEKNEK